MENADAVAERVRFPHDMGREQDRRAEAVTQIAHVVPHGIAGHRIETDSRLVHDEDGRAVQHALRDLEAAEHAPRVVLRELVGSPGEPGRLERFLDALRALVAGNEIEAGRKQKILVAGQ